MASQNWKLMEIRVNLHKFSPTKRVHLLDELLELPCVTMPLTSKTKHLWISSRREDVTCKNCIKILAKRDVEWLGYVQEMYA